MLVWMSYAALVGGIIAAAALALERLAAATGRQRRIVWLAALTLAVLIPLTGGVRKPSAPAPVAVGDPAEMTSPLPEARRTIVRQLPLPMNRDTTRTANMVWAAGSAATLVALATLLTVVARARRRWPRQQVDGTDVHVSRRFGPALVGVITPDIVLPRWVLGLQPAARSAIIRHEAEHARARDHLALLYAGLVLAAFPWSPAIWWMCRRLRAAVEIDCDQRVIASGIGVADYGTVLLEAGSLSQTRRGLALAMGKPKSLLERRLRTMSEKRKKVKAVHAALLGATSLVALGIACDVTAPTQHDDVIEEPASDRPMTPDIDDTSRLANLWYDRFHRAFRDFRVSAGSQAPVIVVDGRRVSGPAGTDYRQDSGFGNPLAALGPEGIARIEILIGAAARAIYGEEAAGGVIRIVTSGVVGDAPPAHGQGLDKLADRLEDLSDMPGLEHVDIRLRGGRIQEWSGSLNMGGEEIDAVFERFRPLMTHFRDRQGESG